MNQLASAVTSMAVRNAHPDKAPTLNPLFHTALRLINEPIVIEPTSEEERMFGFSDLHDLGIEVSAYRLTTSSPEVQKLASTLLEMVQADKSAENDMYYANLTGDGLRYLEHLGVRECQTATEFDDDMSTAGDLDPTNEAYLDSREMVVLTTDDGAPVGYCIYDLNWHIAATGRKADDVYLEVEVQEAWLQPQLRGRDLGFYLALGVANGAHADIQRLEQLTSWGRRKGEKMQVRFTGDVCSQSGEDFLRKCCNEFLYPYDEDDGEPQVPQLLKATKVDYAANW